MPIVTPEDIEKAKKNMEDSLEAFMNTEMNSLVRDGVEVFAKDAIKFNISSSNSKVVTNTAVTEFSYVIIAYVSTLVFPQKNVDELVGKIIKNKNSVVDLKNLDIQYHSMKLESDLGNLEMEVLASVKYKPSFDIEQFKKDILGKNYSDIEVLIKEKYKQIDGNIEPKTFPSFMTGKISKFSKMTNIKVE